MKTVVTLLSLSLSLLFCLWSLIRPVVTVSVASPPARLPAEVEEGLGFGKRKKIWFRHTKKRTKKGEEEAALSSNLLRRLPLGVVLEELRVLLGVQKSTAHSKATCIRSK